MKLFKLFFSVCLALSMNYAVAQLCPQDDRYTNAAYFSDKQIDSLKNRNYGNAINYKGKAKDLNMDFYFPNNAIDSLAKRPFILLIHGGGFYGGKREQMNRQSREFAKRGFVTATMSYRLGFDTSNNDGITRAVYRAHQDANAALRHVVSNADALKIDTSWIFVGGSSAGAVTSLVVSYVNQSEWNQLVPQLESELCPLALSGNTLRQTFEIKGIYNHSGAIQATTLDVEDLIPTISFHGARDSIVPIGKSSIGFGSRPIHTMLNEAGVCNDFTMVPNRGHNIFYSQKGENFRVNRVANFFKSLFCDTCISYTSE
jgi:acetyl esterase/lipase